MDILQLTIYQVSALAVAPPVLVACTNIEPQDFRNTLTEALVVLL